MSVVDRAHSDEEASAALSTEALVMELIKTELQIHEERALIHLLCKALQMNPKLASAVQKEILDGKDETARLAREAIKTGTYNDPSLKRLRAGMTGTTE